MKTAKQNIIVVFLASICIMLFFVLLFSERRDDNNLSLRYTSTPLPLIDIFTPCEIVKVNVLKGDTLDNIAVNYGISKEIIVQYNKLETNELSNGMIVLIPLCSELSK
ncbi:MAG: LysM peptidoglycan-binding domain-containing protein [Anaerolineales bacterium]|nr:LysM peptidoglycan-binding domain-containing protein [Anaerolineales bacterium]